ncbi:MAG: hypothetical protein ACRENP_19085 [Longimicrobiales bacterium]
MRPIALLCAASLFVSAAPGLAQQPAKRLLAVDDFARIKSVADPQLSPDGE